MHPYRVHLDVHGLSHGLKIARQLSIFTPVCDWCRPFKSVPIKKVQQQKLLDFSKLLPILIICSLMLFYQVCSEYIYILDNWSNRRIDGLHLYLW